MSEASNTSLVDPSRQWISKSPRLRGITTPTAGYTIVGACDGSSGPVNQSGAFGGTLGAMRTPLSRAITSALATLSVYEACTFVLPAVNIVSIDA